MRKKKGCRQLGGLLPISQSWSLELAIGRAGTGWAGPTLGWAKTGPGQNWPGFFGQKF